jgi:hypothetical protein
MREGIVDSHSVFCHQTKENVLDVPDEEMNNEAKRG